MPDVNLDFFNNYSATIKLKSAEFIESKKIKHSKAKIQSVIESIHFKKRKSESNIIGYIASEQIVSDSNKDAEFDVVEPPPSDFLSASKLSKGRELLERLLNEPSLQEEILFSNTKKLLLSDRVFDESKKETISFQIEAIPKKFHEDSLNQHFSIEGEDVYNPLTFMKKNKPNSFYENLESCFKDLQIDTLFLFYQILLYRYGSAGFFNLCLLLNKKALEDLTKSIEVQKRLKVQFERLHIDIRDDLGGRVHLKYHIRYNLFLKDDLKETLKVCRELMIPRSELIKAWKGTTHLPLIELKDCFNGNHN